MSSWSCERCTLINHTADHNVISCSICGHPQRVDSWPRFSGQSHELESFLLAHLSTTCSWISVDNPNAAPSKVDRLDPATKTKALAVLKPMEVRSRTVVKQAAKDAAVEELLALARECGHVSGKFLLRLEEERVRDVFSRVAHATHAGQLGMSIKVSGAGSGRDLGGRVHDGSIR